MRKNSTSFKNARIFCPDDSENRWREVAFRRVSLSAALQSIHSAAFTPVATAGATDGSGAYGFADIDGGTDAYCTAAGANDTGGCADAGGAHGIEYEYALAPRGALVNVGNGCAGTA